MPDRDGTELDPAYVDSAVPAEEHDSKYTIGYGKPPRTTRFKPGRSGNPSGRARKSSTFDDDIEKELSTPIVVVENGKQKKVMKRRAIAIQQVNKALKGDIRSTELLFKDRKQKQSEQQDNLGSLLEEFREKNRRLQPASGISQDPSPDLANSSSPPDAKDKK